MRGADHPETPNLNTMEDFQTSLNLFLSELQKYQGKAPEISIDYARGKITIVESSSGFIKQIAKSDRIMIHLSKDGLSVEYLKDNLHNRLNNAI